MTSTNRQLALTLQRQFGMLTFQFLLGMAVNLIGLPDEVHGLAKTSTIGGILTLLAPGSSWWSYLMAVAFISAFGIYGRLFSLAGSTASAEPR